VLNRNVLFFCLILYWRGLYRWVYCRFRILKWAAVRWRVEERCLLSNRLWHFRRICFYGNWSRQFLINLFALRNVKFCTIEIFFQEVIFKFDFTFWINNQTVLRSICLTFRLSLHSNLLKHLIYFNILSRDYWWFHKINLLHSFWLGLCLNPRQVFSLKRHFCYLEGMTLRLNETCITLYCSRWFSWLELFRHMSQFSCPSWNTTSFRIDLLN
jgi:hypothetical protein